MDTLPRMLVFVFLISAMLGVGMQTTAGDLRSLLQARGFLVRCLIANFVVVPIVGVVMASTLPLRPEAATALLLLACTPGGLSALQFATRLKGASLFAASSALVMTLVAVFLSPVLLAVVHPGNISVKIPYGRALAFVAVFLLLPLLAGMFVRSRKERLAKTVSKLCAVLGAITFVLVVILVMAFRKDAMNNVGKEAVVCMLLFVMVSMTVGWLLGGPAKETRAVLATVTGMRHVALCLLIALETFPDQSVQTPLVAFSALMLPPSLLLTAYMLVRDRLAKKSDVSAQTALQISGRSR